MIPSLKSQHLWLKSLATGPLVRLLLWGLWLRVVAADLVQWYVQRKEQLCLFPDTAIYWLLAGKLVRGEPYEVVDFGALPHFAVRTPGYPLFLAGCQWLFGERLLPVRLVQALLGTVCVAMAARLTERSVRDTRCIARWGVWGTLPMMAAAWTAFDPFVVGNSALVLSEALFLPLLLLAQWGLSVLWAAAGEDGPPARVRVGWGLLTGVATGAAVLVRPSWALYIPAALALWVVCEPRCRRWAATRGALLVVLGVVLVMLPWWVRNARIYGRFVPTALWMGASLYDGLNPDATGDSHMDFLAAPEFWPLDEEAQDAAFRDQAIAFALAHPRRVVTLALSKAARFWSPWPNAAAFRRGPFMLVSTLVTLPQFVLLAIGLWDRRRDVRALVLLALPLAYVFSVHLIFVSSMRYRIPVAVPAFGLVAVGLRRLAGARGRAPVERV